MNSVDDRLYITLSIDLKQDTKNPTLEIREGYYNGFTIVYDPKSDGHCRLNELQEYVTLSVFGDE